MNRRYFIGSAVAAGLAAAKKSVAANDKVNVGLIGVGGRGRDLMEDFAALPDVNIVYLCDVDQASLERAMAILDREGVKRPPTTGDMRRVFDDKSINAVVIVFNDHAFGNVLRDQKTEFGGRTIGVKLHNPDFMKLAEAYGARGVRAHGAEELEAALREALAVDAPTLIEIPVSMMPSPF